MSFLLSGLPISYALLTSVFIVISLVACDRVTRQDRVPPAAPVLLETGPEESFRESGIDAVPQDDWIRIEWTVGEGKDLAGYEIYRRAEDEAALSLIFTLPVGEVEETSPDTAFWHDKSVRILVRYFYQMRSFDSSGNRSDFSNTVDYKLLPKLLPIWPKGEIEDGAPEFQFWWGQNPEEVSSIIIRLLDSGDKPLWISKPVVPRGYGEKVVVEYNFDGRAAIPVLHPGSYRWRVDSIGPERRSGSESRWTEFSVK
ncbi:MAG: hypothetical protein J7J76_09170 [Candidatus Latescibacteria bacterium]|nr:hypothetical protein [Candidatus Latescibacterota bacterium]